MKLMKKHKCFFLTQLNGQEFKNNSMNYEIKNAKEFLLRERKQPQI
jgi:hypothetical protein